MAGSYSNLQFQMYYRGAGAPLRIIVYLQAGSSGYSWDSNTSFSMSYQTYKSNFSAPATEMGSMPIKPSDMVNRPSYIKSSLSSGEWCTIYDSDFVPNAYTKYGPFWTVPPAGYYKNLTIGNTTNRINNNHGDQISTFTIGMKYLTAGSTEPHITITTRAPNYDINMVYEFVAHAGSSRVVIGETTETSFYLPIPLEPFAEDITNSDSKTYDVRMNVYGTRSTGARWQLYHYNPGTGTNVAIPSTVKPTISSVAPSDSQGYRNEYGVYIATKSILQASVNASGIYGSTITKVEHQIDDKNVSTTDPSITKLIGTLNSSGSRTLKTTVTDSRGHTATRNTAITVTPYVIPTLFFQANRWDTTNNEVSDDSTVVRLVATGTISSINGHSVGGTLTIKRRLKDASSWTTVGTYSVSGPSFTKQVNISGQSIDNWYEYQATLTDEFGTQLINDASVGNATPILEFNGSGKGIGIGTVAPSDGLDIGMRANFQDTSGNQYTSIRISDPAGDNTVNLACLNGDALWLLENVLGSYDRAAIYSHIFMRNDKALGWLTSSGAETSVLKMNTSNRIEFNWTSGGLGGRVFKQIWSGTWSGGSITVSEAPYYNLFGFNFGNPSGQSWTGLGFRNSNTIHAFTFSWNSSGAPIASVAVKITANGTSLSLTGKSQVGLWLNEWDKNALQSNAGITKIWGIL